MTISNSHDYLLKQVMAADADEWRSLSTESTPMLKKKGRQSITTYNVLLLFMLSIFMFMTGTSLLDCLQNTRLRSLALALSVLLFMCHVVYQSFSGTYLHKEQQIVPAVNIVGRYNIQSPS